MLQLYKILIKVLLGMKAFLEAWLLGVRQSTFVSNHMRASPMTRLIMMTIACLMLSPANASEERLRIGDYYLISRGDDGKFRGSHKLFKENSRGLYEVAYCGKTYWVRAKTVAWTQVEKEKQRSINIEFNKGRGWLPICAKPEDHVKLEDIGVSLEPNEMLHLSDREFQRINRFAAISQSFKTLGNSEAKASFHGR